MGAVYRAKDRLSDETVAVKRVLIDVDLTEEAAHQFRLALTAEFQTLASLRHPNIIDVLDYGFDDAQQPYFVMPLLQDAHTLLEAADSADDVGKVTLLIEVLQALAYLHRRGVIHRDLKPENVLVTEDRPRVLDFGLASEQGRDEKENSVSGTLYYIAPEVIRSKGATAASDLYAVGVMAYEIFVGVHPYAPAQPNLATLLNNLLYEVPSLADLPYELDTPEPVSYSVPLDRIIGRLLEKDPQDRYQRAEEVMLHLSTLIGQPEPPETAEIRDSYLQAARFVGRDAELVALSQALAEAKQGSGSLWLIGGESGVGKSRLLDELRVQALVQGAQVVRGQAAADRQLPYQLWREPLRRRLLAAPRTDMQAAVLRELVPDIERVLGRAIPAAPALIGADHDKRLSVEIANLFRDAQEPIVLLLEDLHWATETLEPLRLLGQQIAELPLLIVGSFRDDETPHLPEQLPSSRQLILQRLDSAAIRELTESMLGQEAAHDEVTELLERETEGNVFFLVETVRALAESAGSLDAVGKQTLPANVLAGGVRSMVERRLERVPEHYRPLLKLAAVAGRELDFALLRRAQQDSVSDLVRATNRDDWLTACANLSIFTNWDGRWRFAHDKLREILIEEMTLAERHAHYQQIAQTVEAVYPDDPAQALVLADHWRDAGDPAREAQYALIAGELSLNTGQFDRALSLFDRALQGFTGNDSEMTVQTMSLYKLRGDVFEAQSEYERALAEYDHSLRIARALDDANGIAAALDGRGDIAEKRGQLAEAQTYYEEALTFAQLAHARTQVAQTNKGLGTVFAKRGELDTAEAYYEQALQAFREVDLQRGIGATLNNLGIIADMRGNAAQARAYYVEALTIRRELGDRRGTADTLNNLGIIAKNTGNLSNAIDYFSQATEVFEEIGNPLGIITVFNNLGEIYLKKRDYGAAAACFDEAISRAIHIGDQRSYATALYNRAHVMLLQGDAPQAMPLLENSLQIMRVVGDRRGTARSLLYLGIAHREIKQHMQAQANLVSATELFDEIGDDNDSIRTRVHLATTLLQRGKVHDGRQVLDTLLQPMYDGQHRLLVVVFAGYIEWLMATQHYEEAARLFGFVRDVESRAEIETLVINIPLVAARLAQQRKAEALERLYSAGKEINAQGWIARLRTLK